MAGRPGPRDAAARSFAPCAVVPIYNHGRTIAATANALAAHGLPVLIVDDGSNDETRDILDAVVAGRDELRLIRLPENAGKGAALTAGFLAAHAAGYSHVLQIDADGQHDIADVPRFLAEARATPEAMICGKPIYDDTVPRARLYGRYLTHACVWVETLSFDIQDSMCGYRLYPLTDTCAEMVTVIGSVPWSTRPPCSPAGPAATTCGGWPAPNGCPTSGWPRSSTIDADPPSAPGRDGPPSLLFWPPRTIETSPELVGSVDPARASASIRVIPPASATGPG